jgi:putative glutamine amidotransferase
MACTPPPPEPAPVVGISCCRKVPEAFPFHSVGEKYITAVTDAAGALPLLIPALGSRLDVDHVLAQLDGLVLTGSPSNIEPHHYGGGPEPENNRTDPDRDATTLPLVRRAVDQGVPLFGLCRGAQEVNVAFGGTLHQELHRIDGRFDHRSDRSKSPAARYAPRHRVRLTPGGFLAALLGRETIEVNSLHGQGIDRVGERLIVEAVAEDGTVEAVRVDGARRFAVAVQWHPEFRPLMNRTATRLFRAFAEATRDRARERRPADVA